MTLITTIKRRRAERRANKFRNQAGSRLMLMPRREEPTKPQRSLTQSERDELLRWAKNIEVKEVVKGLTPHLASLINVNDILEAIRPEVRSIIQSLVRNAAKEILIKEVVPAINRRFDDLRSGLERITANCGGGAGDEKLVAILNSLTELIASKNSREVVVKHSDGSTSTLSYGKPPEANFGKR